MILTNTKTGEKWLTNNQTFVARMIGVSRQTIWRWKKKNKKQVFNHWILKF